MTSTFFTVCQFYIMTDKVYHSQFFGRLVLEKHDFAPMKVQNIRNSCTNAGIPSKPEFHANS